ncbi:hypothetical protein [Tautonia sociabilis]|uniref:Uncharacterized protein n=1 Tax=Tautonia sociabilis TaxID=2080755 RepID=A0A432MJK5_9BACT|nr:hypothetical protein [Tautonia sociabilis]RUL87581.1 hypothetical protein TsocGM_11265 [Tautonia sociabilis]
MTRRSSGSVLAPLLIALAGTGCGGGGGGEVPAYEIHDASQFSQDDLNAPLSAEARAKGAQVPPPPTR